MEINIAIIGLILSFFFAGAEAAYTAFNKVRLEAWDRQGNKLARIAKQFLKRPEDFFSTILIGNNLANILYTTFGTVLLIIYMDEAAAGIVLTLTVVFFGEILPKTIFRSLADKIVLQILYLVRIFYFTLRPFIWFINFFIELFLKLFKIPHEPVHLFFSRDDLEMLLREQQIDSWIDEQKYIRKILSFSETKVSEVMIPRTEMPAVELKAGWDKIYTAMMQTDDRYVLIYRKSLDDIKGVVFAYDLLQDEENIENIIHDVYFVPENKNCAPLLKEFQQRNISLAVVLDEYGGTAGVVTTDELVEEVFGRFLLEEEKGLELKALNEHTWLIDARYELDELKERLNVSFPVGDFETLAGMIMNQTGRIPKIKEEIVFNDFRIVIVSASSNKIHKVKLIKKLG